MAKREKRVVIAQEITKEQAEVYLAEYAKANSQLQKIEAEINFHLTKIREKYHDQITNLIEEKKKAGDMLEAFASQNKETMFSKKKSMDFTHGKIGYQLGQWKCALATGFKWKAALELVKIKLPKYLRTPEPEVNKELLIQDRKEEGITDLAKECGILIKQDETFFIEPKKEEIEA